MSPSPEAPRAVVACPACGRRNRVPPVASGVPSCAACHKPLPWLVEADDATFAAVTAGRLPVLVDLWAPWCGPCRAVGPAIEDITLRFAGRLKTVKVNVDVAPTVARSLGVQGVPTLLVVRDGAVIARQVGALPGPALEGWVAELLQPTPA
jgi:thioredoxin 2